ncbi:hypothetical protein SD70_12140 [Gordoniibacillus kamchatkensis]|uniref:Sulfotransferase family protein n=1 Tax=Gordoniibacillus kamchatkensis TaxID=1590651 RepID=A0ABR5AIC6_9BACL|nr:sulfotransferase [Paenibacillus sp. VKM B-2647]KIL40657.1 hypothetical protein SD70_12140 [Paenibacillus sp. VKM B-2647]
MAPNYEMESIYKNLFEMDKGLNLSENAGIVVKYLKSHDNIFFDLLKLISERIINKELICNLLAVEAFNRQEYDYVIPFLKVVLDINDSHRDTLFNLCLILSQFGEFELARKYAYRILNKDSEFFELLNRINRSQQFANQSESKKYPELIATSDVDKVLGEDILSTSSSMVVSVLGMHRSGTSLLARCLFELGVYLGEEHNLIPANEDNPDGFWEHKWIVDLHDKILSEFGLEWHSREILPENWWTFSKIDEYKEKLRSVVMEQFSKRTIWGWKDPRTSLMIPIWNELLEKMSARQKYIICIRNPLEVADSLKKRNEFPLEISLTLWEYQTLSALFWTSGKDRIIVHYDKLLNSPMQELERITDFLELDRSLLNKVQLNQLIKPQLRHSSKCLSDLTTLGCNGIYEIYKACIENEKNENQDKFNQFVYSSYRNYCFYSRGLSKATPNSGVKMQIFWKTKSEGFSEESSLKISTFTDNRFHIYRINLPNCVYGPIRIDPTDHASEIEVRSIKLFDGEELLSSSNILNNFAYLSIMNGLIPIEKTSDSLVFISPSTDPHFLYDVIVADKNALILEIEMRVSPHIQMKYYNSLLNQVQPLNKYV